MTCVLWFSECINYCVETGGGGQRTVNNIFPTEHNMTSVTVALIKGTVKQKETLQR